VVSSRETVVIARSTSEVFAFTADLRNEPRWDVDVDSVADEVAGQPEIGTKCRVRFAPFLGESTGTLTVVDLVPGARLLLEADFVGLTWTITHLYAAEGAGTCFTRQVEVKPVGMLRVVEPFFVRRVRRNNRRDVRNLKLVLEAD
jgi:hypothetical protein